MEITSLEQARMYDIFLKTLSENPRMIEEMYNPELSYYKDIIALLAEEGLVKTDDTCIEITFKGRVFYEDGGFVRQYKRSGRMYIFSIIAAVSSLIAAIVAIGSIVLQFLMK